MIPSWLYVEARESYFRGRERPASSLGDPDSRFKELGEGITVHCKGMMPRSWRAGGKVRAAMHCWHGFGANLWSWAPVQQRLATELDALVSSHDMPGFGLTSRPERLEGYSQPVNARLGRLVLESELSGNGLKANAGAAAVASSTGPPRVLLGHSVGGAAAIASYVGNPEGVAAVVLVAPLLQPPRTACWLSVRDADSSSSSLLRDERIQAEARAAGVALASKASGSPSAPPPWSGGDGSGAKPVGLLGRCAPAIMFVALRLVTLALVLLAPLERTLLTVVVRSRSFWAASLRWVVHNTGMVTASMVDAYRLPQLAPGWKNGMLRFTRSRLACTAAALAAQAASGTAAPALVSRFASEVQRRGTPVLIIHGVEDRVVSISGSQRGLAVIPGAQLLEISGCGHMPHEELPGLFCAAVAAWLGSVLADAAETQD